MIVPVFRRKTGDRNAARWAADWWRYPEAVIRLEALWRSWEHLRLDPALGMSIWLRDHADYHLGVLFASDGPFAKSEDASNHGAPCRTQPRPPACLATRQSRTLSPTDRCRNATVSYREQDA